MFVCYILHVHFCPLLFVCATFLHVFSMFVCYILHVHLCPLLFVLLLCTCIYMFVCYILHVNVNVLDHFCMFVCIAMHPLTMVEKIQFRRSCMLGSQLHNLFFHGSFFNCQQHYSFGNSESALRGLSLS